MSRRIKGGFVDFVVFSSEIERVAFRRYRFWCEIGAVRHTSLAGQRVIDHASRTVGSNPTLSAIDLGGLLANSVERPQNPQQTGTS
jgi:hypothetical protein